MHNISSYVLLDFLRSDSHELGLYTFFKGGVRGFVLLAIAEITFPIYYLLSLKIVKKYDGWSVEYLYR